MIEQEHPGHNEEMVAIPAKVGETAQLLEPLGPFERWLVRNQKNIRLFYAGRKEELRVSKIEFKEDSKLIEMHINWTGNGCAPLISFASQSMPLNISADLGRQDINELGRAPIIYPLDHDYIHIQGT